MRQHTLIGQCPYHDLLMAVNYYTKHLLQTRLVFRITHFEKVQFQQLKPNVYLTLKSFRDILFKYKISKRLALTETSK